MQYPKDFTNIKNNNQSWAVPEVQSGKKVDEHVSGSDAGQTNLMINYLPSDMTENELLDIFGKFGEVVKHKIIRNKLTGQSLGYGFVEFRNECVARVAQIMCDRHEIRGKSLKVAFARPRSEDILNANLYVAYLPPDVNDEKLSTLFGCYGTIIDAKVLRCKLTGKSRGVGFVRFDQRMAAEVAIKALDNHVLQDATRPILVQFANGPTKSHMHERFCFSPNDDATDGAPTKSQKDQERYPHRPIKRRMEPEMELTAKRSSFPPTNRRQMESNIQQGQIWPNIQQRRMEPNIQQHQKNDIHQRLMSQASNPYPWLERPMDAEIEKFAKLASGYVDPHDE